MYSGKTYKILLAIEETSISHNAIEYAFDLCSRLKDPYILSIIYVIALNPETSVPFLHNLDKANNLDILLDAKETVGKLRDYLKTYDKTYPDVQYDFIEHESHGTVGEILTEYISLQQPNLLIIGSRNLEGLQKVRLLFPRISSIVLSSTSEYLVRHVCCPVTIIKQ
ncbi:10539_t:CDS:2 [Funneliformis mosseae]|uniref:10539_t:CDS:1 n=2 Tax=Funneliformis TaxID=1117308 RepID=A0A9N9DCZ7_FUNMO|nr:10539_t:CDS:2 [Funneliformis mosseae]